MTPIRRRWRNVPLLLLTHAALSGCATSRAAAGLDAATEADLRAKAELLCRHELHEDFVPSRLPEGVPPEAYVRAEDLAFAVSHPEQVKYTPLDKPGLHPELARHVRCEVTDVLVRGYIVDVPLKQTAPRLPSDALLDTRSPEEARALLERWMQQGPEQVTTEVSIPFVRTDRGLRASYWLPERAEDPVDKSAWPEDPLSSERLTAPRRLSGPIPKFTQEALEHRVEGDWAARCILTREGHMTRCRVLKSLPYMDEALIQTLHASRYAPVTYAGKPVEIEFFYNLRLRLPE
jgi:hypothetical protein